MPHDSEVSMSPDRTMVWATHKVTKGRARVPRSYLDPANSDGWVEDKQQEPVAPAPATQPKARKRASKKER